MTGSSSGIGKELAKILYAKNAKVYIAARSETKALTVIDDIQTAFPSSKGSLIFLKLDLVDLTTIKASVEEFLRKEDKLHVLVNNAGIRAVAKIPERTVQGYEMNLGVNNVGVFLFTKLLTPILNATAQSVPANTVRVVWLSSTIDLAAVKDVGVPLDNLDFHREVSGLDRYGLSKVGSWFQAVEFARLHKKDGIISVALNPGNLATDLTREHTKLMQPNYRYFFTCCSFHSQNFLALSECISEIRLKAETFCIHTISTFCLAFECKIKVLPWCAKPAPRPYW